MKTVKSLSVFFCSFVCCSSLFTHLAWSKEIKVAVGLALPPYVIEESNSGIEVDVVKEVMAQKGHTIKLEYVPFNRLPTMLSEKQADAVLTINENSGIKAFYSESHVTYQNVAVSLKSKNAQISKVDDLANYSILAFKDATKYLGPAYAAMAGKNKNYTEIAKQDTQITHLYKSKVDALVMEVNIFKYFKQSAKGIEDQPYTIHEIFEPTHYKVGFNDEALKNEFNDGLKKIKDSGKYKEIVQRYVK